MTLLVSGCSKPEEVIRREVMLANQNLEEGDTLDAVRRLEKLDRKFPQQAVVLETLGFAYAQASQNEAAAASFVAAADLAPVSSSLRQLAAEAYLSQGAPENAAEQLRLYLNEFPNDFQGWQKLGRIEENLDNIARAIDAYLEWYRLRPSGEAAYRLGTAFRSLNNSPQAKSWFEATIKHGDFGVQTSLFGLLELEIEAGDMDAADKTVGQIDKNFPRALDASPLAGVRDRLAVWQKQQDDIAKARADQERMTRELEEAVLRQQRERDQAEREAAEAAAAATVVAETPPETSFEFDPAQEAGPPLPDESARTRDRASLPEDLRAAIVRREGGDIEGAIEMLWRSLGGDDSRVDLWMELADAYRTIGQYTPAEACILEARRRANKSIEVETAYLNIVRESQPRDTYLARVEAARDRFPANANLAYVFARELFESEGNAVRTVSAYEDFLLLADPADPRRQEAAEFLARVRR